MNWDLKMPQWELGDLEPNAETGIGPVVGQSHGLQGIQAAGHRRFDCSVDLKLGGLGDFGPVDKWKDQQQHQYHQHQHHHQLRESRTAASPSGPSKRSRPPSGGSQNASCLVDGCKSDLSNCREYHRRHKVCEPHSKTPIVLVGGQEQRFCQQCSRFHLLVEFDDVKRSCRKRLDGHNRRRRKAQPDSMSAGGLFSNHQGSRFSSFPQIFPTVATDSSWPIVVKTEEEPPYPHHLSMHFLDRDHHHHLSSSASFPQSFKEGKHFPFLQDPDRATLEATSICQPLLKSLSSAESSSRMFSSSGLTQVTDRALSLLSSQPQTSALNLGQMVPSSDRIPMGQPLLAYGGGLGLGQYSGSGQAANHVSTTGFSCSGMDDEHVGGAVLVSDASDPEMNCRGLFSVGGEGSSDGGSQALPFSWQ